MAVKNSIRLQCVECKEINYLSSKNSKKNPEKLSLRKFCNRCRQTNVHKETKSRK